jgi:hypothetical protein
LQGRGIGSAVLSRLLERCDREDAVVRLNVLRGSSARRLYERHGFTVETEDDVDVFMVRHPVSAWRSGSLDGNQAGWVVLVIIACPLWLAPSAPFRAVTDPASLPPSSDTGKSGITGKVLNCPTG